MANEAFFTAGGNYDAQEFRRLLKTFYESSAPGDVISGLAVVTPSAGQVKVQKGTAFVLDTGGGAYIGATQADSANIAVPAATGSPRTDTIYAVIQDPGSGATAGEMAFARASGTFTIPSLAIPLAYVTAALDGTLTIVDVRTFVTLAAAAAVDTGEYALTFLNGWTIAAGAPFGPTIRRMASKEVYLRADLFDGTADLIFTLPTVYWPVYTRLFYLQNGRVLTVHGSLDADPSLAGQVHFTRLGFPTSIAVSWPAGG